MYKPWGRFFQILCASQKVRTLFDEIVAIILFIRCIQPILSLQILFFYNYLFLFQLFKKSSMAPSSLFILQLLKKGRQRNSEIVHLGLGIWGTKQKIIFFIAKMQISNFKTKINGFKVAKLNLVQLIWLRKIIQKFKIVSTFLQSITRGADFWRGRF